MASRPIHRVFVDILIMVIFLVHLGVRGPYASQVFISCDVVDVGPMRQIVLLYLDISDHAVWVVYVRPMKGR